MCQIDWLTVSNMWSVLCALTQQLLESRPLQDSYSQLVQTGRWWQNLSASGRILKVGPRRCVNISWPLHLFLTNIQGSQAWPHFHLCLWQGTDTSPQKTVSNLLQMMYQDPQRWSYTFQTYSCMSRLRTQLQPPPARLLSSEGTPVQVYERSIYSDRWVGQDRKVKMKSCQGNLNCEKTHNSPIWSRRCLLDQSCFIQSEL